MAHFVVHTLWSPATGELTHDVQCDNAARYEDALRILAEAGYEAIDGTARTDGEYSAVSLWALDAERVYTKAARRPHTDLLRVLSIPVNTPAAVATPHQLSTYRTVPLRRTRRRRAASSSSSSPARRGRLFA